MNAPDSSQAVSARRLAFAALHRRGHPFLLPNAWDVASALLLADADFPAVATTSLGVTAAAGFVDGTGTGRPATMALAASVIPRLQVPVTIDAEGGYSDDPAAVADLAAELAGLGAAGINLEDVAASGGFRPPAAQAAIIGAVAAAAPGLFVNARTDIYWLQHGAPDGRLGETLRRLKAYADAGASGVFVPGLTDQGQIEAVTAEVELPLNVLWRQDLDVPRLAEAGVARISTGSAPYRRALAAGLATALAARDRTEPPAPDVAYDALVGLLLAQSAPATAPGRQPRT
jgi:2-methylisocitrate lyase-like PEP mutase family enzyme